MRFIGVALATAVAMVCAASSVSAATIRTSDGWIVKIGSYSMRGAHGATVGAAIRHWGQPSSRQVLYGGSGCRIEWGRLKIRALFVNYGGGGTACEADAGRLQEMTTRSSRF